jgi:protein-disulfide isomerase
MALNQIVKFLGIVGTAVCLSATPWDTSPENPNTVVVEINGVKVTLADLEQKRASALFQARTNYYEAERKVIEDVINEYLLDQQAKKEGLTVTQLLDKHVNSTIAKDPSDEALRVYYEGLDTNEPYETVRGKILDALKDRRMAKAKSAYVQSLRSQVPIILRLPPPRTLISMKDVPVRGATNAHVRVLEFADYQCPVCQQFEPVMEKLEADFKGKIDFAFKDFPLSMHPDAPKAAEASHCAGAQGKYWEYHDLMFAKKQLDIGSLKSYAGQLNLDTAAFSTCLDKGQMADMVNTQGAEATALGLPGTPTVLVNGRFVSGNLTYERLHAVIAEELSATAELTPASASPSPRNQAQDRMHEPQP